MTSCNEVGSHVMKGTFPGVQAARTDFFFESLVQVDNESENSS